MVTLFIALYFLSLVAGTWTLLHGIAHAPVGYEDDAGFHFGTEAY